MQILGGRACESLSDRLCVVVGARHVSGRRFRHLQNHVRVGLLSPDETEPFIQPALQRVSAGVGLSRKSWFFV
jgi:hypothetical protein